MSESRQRPRCLWAKGQLLLGAGMGLLLLVCATAVQAQDHRNGTNQIDAEYFREYQLAKMTCKEESGPYNTIVAIPMYYYSSSDAATIDYLGTKDKLQKSRGQGAGVALAYARKLSDMFSVTFLYEYSFMHIRGGAPINHVLYDQGLRNTTSERWDSHIAAIAFDINLDKWGRFNLSYAQAWDRGSGGITTWNPNTGTSSRSDVDGSGFNISVLQAWYEVDFNLCNNWKLTPYAGWRSIYADILHDGDVWIHLISAGVKASYSRDKWGFHVRGGINHRTTNDDLPSFGTRSVAPGVLHFAHRTNMDQTVGTYGIGVSYSVNKHLGIAVGYDGFAGKDTTAHMGTLSFAVPF